MTTTAVAEALATAERRSPEELAALPSQIGQLAIETARRKTRLRGLVRSALGVEKTRATKLLSAEKSGFKAKLRELMDLSLYGYLPSLSLEPLTWRHEGNPRLAIMTLEAAAMKFTIRIEQSYNTGNYAVKTKTLMPKLPEELADLYEDVFEALVNRAVRDQTNLSYSCQFAGVIPTSAHLKIDQARDVFGTHIYLLVEAQDSWVLRSTPAPPAPRPADPIVVGYVPGGGRLYIIDTFDLTPLEAYLAAEFAI